MDNNARVKIQVDDSRVKELRNNVGELYEKFARNAREQAKDIREVNRRIEEQIRLLETRNQKASETRRRELEAEFRSGGMSRAEYNRNLKDVEGSASYARGRVADLREMLAADQALPQQQDRARELFRKLTGDIPRGNVASEIDERIRQFERQGQTDIASRAYRLRTRYDQGFITRDQFGRESSSLRADRQSNALLVRLLREIADNTKNEAKNSAEELVKRLGVSSKAAAATRIERLEGKTTGSIEDVMRRQQAATILRNQYGIGGSTTTAVGGGGFFGDMVASGAATLAGRGGALGGALTRLGPAGLAIGASVGLGTWGFKRYQNQAKNARDLAVIHGVSLEQARSMVSGWNSQAALLGLDTDELASRMVSYERAAGRWYSPGQALNMFAQQRALGITDDQYSQILQLGRQGRGGTAPGVVDALARQVSKQYGGLSRLPDALDYFSTAAQNVLSVKGDFNQNAVAGIVSSLMARGVQGSQMGRILGGIQNIGSNGNGLAQGLAFRAASMLKPDASTWDIMKTVSSPLDNIPYLREYMRQAKQLSGGDVNQEKFLLKDVTGLSPHDVDALYDTFLKGTDADIKKKIGAIKTGSGSGEGNLPRADNLTTELEKINTSVNRLKDEVVRVLNDIFGVTSNWDGLRENLKTLLDDNATMGEKIWAAGKASMHANPFTGLGLFLNLIRMMGGGR